MGDGGRQVKSREESECTPAGRQHKCLGEFKFSRKMAPSMCCIIIKSSCLVLIQGSTSWLCPKDLGDLLGLYSLIGMDFGSWLSSYMLSCINVLLKAKAKMWCKYLMFDDLNEKNFFARYRTEKILLTRAVKYSHDYLVFNECRMKCILLYYM